MISAVVFSQASMTDKTYDKLQQYAEEISNGKKADIPDEVKIEKTENSYSIDKYSSQFDYIISNRTKKTIGIFITCVQERSQYDEYRYLILPFNNADKLSEYAKKKGQLVYSTEEFLDMATSYMLSKFIGISNNN